MTHAARIHTGTDGGDRDGAGRVGPAGRVQPWAQRLLVGGSVSVWSREPSGIDPVRLFGASDSAAARRRTEPRRSVRVATDGRRTAAARPGGAARSRYAGRRGQGRGALPARIVRREGRLPLPVRGGHATRSGAHRDSGRGIRGDRGARRHNQTVRDPHTAWNVSLWIWGYEEMKTPYEKLKSLPYASQYLKLGITVEQPNPQEARMRDNDVAMALNHARRKLFQAIPATIRKQA